MEPVTNGQTIEWYKANLNFGKISEAKIKTEEQNKVFKKRIEDFVKNQKNIEKIL